MKKNKHEKVEELIHRIADVRAECTFQEDDPDAIYAIVKQYYVDMYVDADDTFLLDAAEEWLGENPHDIIEEYLRP